MVRIMEKRGVFSKDKNGYFFIIDAFIGTMIIVLTLVIIMNSHISAPESSYTYTIIGDYIQYLSTTEVQDVVNTYTKDLIKNGNITNLENTILLQNLEFYYRNGSDCPECINNLAYNFTKNVVEGVIPEQYGFTYKINGTLIYSRNKSIKGAEMYLQTNRVSYLSVNKSTIFGPVNITIAIWQ